MQILILHFGSSIYTHWIQSFGKVNYVKCGKFHITKSAFEIGLLAIFLVILVYPLQFITIWVILTSSECGSSCLALLSLPFFFPANDQNRFHFLEILMIQIHDFYLQLFHSLYVPLNVKIKSRIPTHYIGCRRSGCFTLVWTYFCRCNFLWCKVHLLGQLTRTSEVACPAVAWDGHLNCWMNWSWCLHVIEKVWRSLIDLWFLPCIIVRRISLMLRS